VVSGDLLCVLLMPPSLLSLIVYFHITNMDLPMS